MAITKTQTNNAVKTYKVTLIFPNQEQKVLNVKENEYISDVANANGIELPLSCNAGVCVTCTAKLVKGSVIHDHAFLKPEEEDAGFLLTCRTFPESNCVILTHQEEALLDF
ncbi:2Fe-2S iron-sulfur cluster-binding protein [Geminocystis sp. NIES-3709]|uniref:2Fe-2S iron-sulfur cluster-binding protein n=1 Tax=Geminocystis sp. NIES-3709 TaxID=1617448 RepID=UPI0005FC76C3|nr:2Fe-2S iron-sulfur cluster-binding protein [Geminocystis sp. NIES-3709]BAQ64412.1 soluble [2Fe-2S] ferredoxin [Geminocystis sp. NIES-3709]